MEYQIYVGGTIKIKKGFMKGTLKLMYCGMSSKDRFVLTPFIGVGYHGFTPSIYYPSNSKFIQVYDKDFEVVEVNPEFIVIAD